MEFAEKKYRREPLALPFSIEATVTWMDEDCCSHSVGFECFVDAREHLAKVLREGALFGEIKRVVTMNTYDALDPEIRGIEVRPAAGTWLDWRAVDAE